MTDEDEYVEYEDDTEFDEEFEEEFDDIEYEPEYEEPVLEWWERHRNPGGYHMLRFDPEYIDADGNLIPEGDPRRQMIRVIQGSEVFEGPKAVWDALS